MAKMLRDAFIALLSAIPSVLTLALLAGVWWWGNANDWKLPNWLGREKEKAEKAEDKPAAATITPNPEAATSADPTTRLDRTRIELSSPEVIEKAGLKWETANEELVEETVHANAMVDYDPSSYAQLSVRAVGTVWWVEKHIGQSVKKGEVLALVEAAEVGKAKADFLQSLTLFDVRTKTLQRLQATANAVPERTLFEGQTALREARIKLFSDQQTLFNLGLPIKLDEVVALPEDQLVRRIRLLGVPAEIIKDRGHEDTLTANLLPLVAPFDGQVVQRSASQGEAALPTRPLFQIADVSQVHFELAVDPVDALRVRVGQRVRFSPEANPQGTPAALAQVAHISPEVDEKIRKVWVHAEADNRIARLRPHTFGVGHIVIEQRPHAVVVPSEAVQTGKENDSHLVFVRVDDRQFEVRVVRLGARLGKNVEVTGVRAGETVVTTGSFVLKSELFHDSLVAE